MDTYNTYDLVIHLSPREITTYDKRPQLTQIFESSRRALLLSLQHRRDMPRNQ
jgi:hypothetical protein